MRTGDVEGGWLMMQGGWVMMKAVACHHPCASRLAPRGPLLSSAKQQDRITRAVLKVSSQRES